MLPKQRKQLYICGIKYKVIPYSKRSKQYVLTNKVLATDSITSTYNKSYEWYAASFCMSLSYRILCVSKQSRTGTPNFFVPQKVMCKFCCLLQKLPPFNGSKLSFTVCFFLDNACATCSNIFHWLITSSIFSMFIFWSQIYWSPKVCLSKSLK